MSQARDFADSFSAVSTGRRNILLNGAMGVAQRATSKTGLTSAGHHTVDRFKTWINGAGTWTASQDTDAPDGFANSFKFENTSIDSSLSSGDYVLFGTNIEGQDLQRLNYGNSNAKSMTLSFWVKSNKTGTYTVEFDFAFGQKKSIQYTVSASDTWEYKTLTYSGNTNSSYVIDNVATSEVGVYFWLAAGSQYSSGTTTDDAWHSTDADRAAGNVNLADSTSNTWQITGVQLEVGNSASPFEHRSFGEELALCQRYFCKSYNYSVAVGTASTDGQWTGNIVRNGSNQNYWHIEYPVEMRAKATTKHYSPSDGAGTTQFRNLTDSENRSSAASNTGSAGSSVRPNSGTNQGLGDVIGFHWTADAEL